MAYICSCMGFDTIYEYSCTIQNPNLKGTGCIQDSNSRHLHVHTVHPDQERKNTVAKISLRILSSFVENRLIICLNCFFYVHTVHVYVPRWLISYLDTHLLTMYFGLITSSIIKLK